MILARESRPCLVHLLFHLFSILFSVSAVVLRHLPLLDADLFLFFFGLP